MKIGETFKVDTSPTKEVVVDSLTRDASVAACIFDLIDNSVDAAREDIARHSGEETFTVVESYDGYEIHLLISGASLSISDNCGGIEVEELRHSALRFGERSAHDLGIGVFGVGLNRALFKLGRTALISTETTDNRVRVALNVAEYLQAKAGWQLSATVVPLTGERGTTIEIDDILADIGKLTGDEGWRNDIEEEISQRYGRFISRGLVLSFNGTIVPSHEAVIRQDGPVDGEYKFYRTDDGVWVHIQYGQHPDHRFSNEEGDSPGLNRTLTSEFGWTIYCNERAVIIADTTYKTGWDRFHTEFNGFVGIVRFVSERPERLPWSTTKTDIDLNNPAYQAALTDMRRFAEKWRSFAEQRKKGARKGEKIRAIPSRGPAPGSEIPKKPAGPRGPAARTDGPLRKPVTKHDHNQSRMLLPDDVDERHCFDKHLSLVHEAKLIDLADHTYAGLGLMRMLFEASVVTYLGRHKKYEDLKAFALAKRREKITVPVSDEKTFTPKMEEMLAFLTSDLDALGAEKGRYLKHGLQKMVSHMPRLNGVMHNPLQPIHKGLAFEIRDEVLPILRHLIEG